MRVGQIEHRQERLVATFDGDTATPVASWSQRRLLEICMAREAPAPIGDPIPCANLTVLAPLGTPPSFRDFYAFEDHVRTSRATQKLDMDPRWYDEPVFYFSNPSAFLGPESSVAPPRSCVALDYELEVACVIGLPVQDLNPDEPSWTDYVAGFAVLNDWSARDVQSREMTQGLGPSKGKDFATSIGPYIVTPDELDEVAVTGRMTGHLYARVNGTSLSGGDLSAMYFTWPQIIAHASADARLVPGDVLGSGTCGTGCLLELRSTMARGERPPWLAPGDIVELEVDGLGILQNQIIVRTDSGDSRESA